MLRYFTTPNPADDTILHGRLWMADHPIATLALLHGLGEHSGRYAELGETLAAQGITVCALDLHGHGKTQASGQGKRGVVNDYTLMLGDVAAALEKARFAAPDVPVFLMGHSMGGGLALSYALKNPQAELSGIIAQAPFINPAPVRSVPAWQVSVIKCLHKLMPNFTVKSDIKGHEITSLTKEGARYEEDPLIHGYLGAGLGIAMFETGEQIKAHHGEFPYPLYLSHGSDDVLTDYTASVDLAERTPNATFTAYPGAAHEVHHDFCRAEVHTDLITWIRLKI